MPMQSVDSLLHQRSIRSCLAPMRPSTEPLPTDSLTGADKETWFPIVWTIQRPYGSYLDIQHTPEHCWI